MEIHYLRVKYESPRISWMKSLDFMTISAQNRFWIQGNTSFVLHDSVVHLLGTLVLNFNRLIGEVENITISSATQPQVRVVFLINSNRSYGRRTLDRYFLSRLATRLSSESVKVFENDWLRIWLTARASYIVYRVSSSVYVGFWMPILSLCWS